VLTLPYRPIAVFTEGPGLKATPSSGNVKRAYPSQGEGRAQKVVEPKPELAFGIAPGSQGGSGEPGACPPGRLPLNAAQLVRKRLVLPFGQVRY